MTELIITEKPSTALKIAAALADSSPTKKSVNKVAYYEISHKGKDIIIVSAVGHLYTVAEKNKAGWVYPVFDVEWKVSADVNKGSAFTKKYLNVIKSLAKTADSFCVATDFDIEGEVIGYNIVRFACKKKDAKRMKFSALTKEELLDSYEHASPHMIWGQAEAGLTRHELDWLWGINISRALTLSIKNSTGRHKILSSGRVQGPALHVLVNREKEIKAFKSVPYWQIELQAKNGLNALHKKDKFWNKVEADNVMSHIKGKVPIVSKVKSEEFEQLPPNPFDLTSLQLEAYRTLKLSPKDTSDIAQDLYTSSYISYPRTSSNQLPPTLNFKKILSDLSNQAEFKDLANELLKKSGLKPNNGKKSDPAHPAIYPTGIIPENLSGKSKDLYELIVRRFLAAFADPAIRESLHIDIDVDGEFFGASGIKTLKQNWHRFYGRFVRHDEVELPSIKEGERLEVKEFVLYDKETQPPKRYTPASLVKVLERKKLGTKSISGDTPVYINGEWIALRRLFESGEKTNEELLVRIPVATFYNLDREKIELKRNILVSKRFKEKDERIISIGTPFTKLISDSEHKYFLVGSNKRVYEKQADSIKVGDTLLFTPLNSFGAELITKGWLGSVKRKYKLQDRDGKMYYQNGAGFEIKSLPLLESSKLFWLLGYIYGDGSIYQRGNYEGYAINITIDKNEKFLISKIIKAVEDLFGKGSYGITTPSNRNVIRINIASCISYYLIRKFPKLLSKSVFDVPRRYSGDFVRGYMDSDGNVHLRKKGDTKLLGHKVMSHGTPRIKLCLARKDHVLWVENMLNSLGVKTTSLKHKLAKIKDKAYSSYEIKISGKYNVLLYAILVGFEHPRKRYVLYKGLLNDSIQYKPIKKIITCFSEIMKNNNCSTKFEDKLTYVLRIYNQLGLIERKRVSIGSSRKYYIQIPQSLLTKVSNFLLVLYGEEVLPWTYAVKVSECSCIQYNEDWLYDLIIDKENPTFITLGGQVIHNSTRADIIESLYQRDYIKERAIEVTDLGIKTIEVLEKYSPEIVDEKLTRHFEKEMGQIMKSKKKGTDIIEEAKIVLTASLKHFKENEINIGKGLAEAFTETMNQSSIVGKCPACQSDLRIKYSKKNKSYFVACSNYPDCKTTFSLPKYALPKPAGKTCDSCGYPLVVMIRKGKRPFEYCLNPNCKKKEEWFNNSLNHNM